VLDYILYYMHIYNIYIYYLIKYYLIIIKPSSGINLGNGQAMVVAWRRYGKI